MFALGVVVKVPVPKQTAKTNFQTTSGKAKYNASIDSLVWKYVLPLGVTFILLRTFSTHTLQVVNLL
jgi:hypothetical protein